MTSRSNAAPGRFDLLDIVVLIALAITATAFAAGLIINSGIDTMTGVIGIKVWVYKGEVMPKSEQAALAAHIAECSLCQGASKQFTALFSAVGAYLKGDAPDTEA